MLITYNDVLVMRSTSTKRLDYSGHFVAL